MVDTVPPWLAVARKYLGEEEIPGPRSNPTILHFIVNISTAFPDQSNYASNYKNDDTAWCGVFAANAMAEVGIRPVYDPKDDLKSWMWADAWMGFGVASAPRVGAILCFGGHVALLNRIIDADTFEVIGGNQSSPQGGAVTLSKRPGSSVRAIRWPAETGSVAQALPVTTERPLIKINDNGPFVSELQRLLGVDVDGEFGPITATAVRAFQASHGLEIDGEVGPQTWAALLGTGSTTKPAVAAGVLTPELIAQITSLAGASELARYHWNDRGVAPIGYIKGMAVTFAKVYLDLKAGGSAARVMAELPTGDTEHDALAWYGVTNISAGVSSLRALFSLLIGLGMRESSGKYYEGRDRSANNVESDTAEAGLFQQSWDSHTASPELSRLLAAYTAKPEGFLSIFAEGANGSSDSVGDGDGLRFQLLCKAAPAFAVECAAVGLRVLRKHWGPINRREAEMRPEADALLLKVQAAVDAATVLSPPIDGEILPPLKVDDDLLKIIITIILSEENTAMDANLRALLIQALTSPTQDPNIRARLLEALGEKAPPPPPPVLGPMGGGLDFGKLLPILMPLLQKPEVQRLLPELLPLIPQLIAAFTGQAVPQLPPPVVQPPPPAPTTTTTPPDTTPAVQRPSVLTSFAAMAAAIGGMLTGHVGTPFGMGMNPTDVGTASVVVPALSAVFGMMGGWQGILRLGMKVITMLPK